MELITKVKNFYNNFNVIDEKWLTNKLNDFNVIYTNKEFKVLQNLVGILNWNKILLHSFLQRIGYEENLLPYKCSEIICFLRILINKNVNETITKASELYAKFLLIKRDVNAICFNNIELIENKLSHLLIISDCSYETINNLLSFVKKLLDEGDNSNIENCLINTLYIISEFNLCKFKSNDVLNIFESKEPEFWEKEIHDLAVRTTFKGGQERSFDELLDFIDKNNELISREDFKIKYNHVMNSYCSTSKVMLGSKTSSRSIANWSRLDIMDWSRNIKKGFSVSQSEMIAVIKRAVEIETFHSPRVVQILSLIALLNPQENKGRLMQINTGEGKSIIVAMFAAIKALQGYKVDVITTSTELSIPEAIKQIPFFDMLSLTVGENSNPSTKKKVYAKHIVYGIASDFMGDILRTEYFGENIRMGRNFEIAIIDEVDSMLIDGRSSCVQFSSCMPGMNHLVIALAETFKMVNNKSQQFVTGLSGIEDKIFFVTEIFNVTNKKIEILSGKVFKDCIIPVEISRKEFLKEYTINNLKNLFRELNNDEELELLSFKKIEQEIFKIDKKINDLKINRNNKIGHIFEEKKNELIMKKSKLPWNQRYPVVEVPKHLHSFVLGHIPHWVESAIRALNYKCERHYDIKNNQIVPIDHSNTGVLQNQVNWSDGLCQFLQIKEGLKITPENLSTTFISNIEFFKRYNNNIFGLTGTLGSEDSKMLLCNVYNTDTVTIPPYKINKIVDNLNLKYLCKELPAIINDTEEMWYKSIFDSTLSKVNNQRGVLIICKYIAEVKKLHELFKTKYESDKIYPYTGQEEFNKCFIKEGEIIIATNIAGRGTDLKTSSTIENNGGLHVCLTFLPGNLRVELQNVGRTSRIGLKGTSQLIIYNRDITNIHSLRVSRDRNEAKAMEKAQQDVNNMNLRDSLFKKFSLLQKNNFQYFKDHTFERQDLEEQWAIWLRGISDEIDRANDLDTRNRILEKFESFSTSTMSSVQKIYNPLFHVLKGNELLKKEKYNFAIKEYDKAIKLDSKLSLNAYYNKACCVIIEKNGEKDGQLSAQKELKKAEALIRTYYIPNLIDLLTIISQVSSGKELIQQIQNQLHILKVQQTYIEEALQVIEKTLEQGWCVKIDCIELYKIFERAHVCHENEIEEAHLNGLHCVFKLTEKPKSWSWLFLCALSLIQLVVAGVISYYFPNLKELLLSMLIVGGVTDFSNAVKAFCDGIFNWGSWAKNKFCDIVLVFTNISPKFKKIYNFFFSRSTKNNLFEEIGAEFINQLNTELRNVALDKGVDITTSIIEEILAPTVTNTVSYVIEKNEIIKNALIIDQINKNTYWQTKLIRDCIEICLNDICSYVEGAQYKVCLNKYIDLYQAKLKEYENIINEQFNETSSEVINKTIKELIHSITEVDDDEIPVIDIRYQNISHTKEVNTSFTIDLELIKLQLSKSIIEILALNLIKRLKNAATLISKLYQLFNTFKEETKE